MTLAEALALILTLYVPYASYALQKPGMNRLPAIGTIKPSIVMEEEGNTRMRKTLSTKEGIDTERLNTQ